MFPLIILWEEAINGYKKSEGIPPSLQGVDKVFVYTLSDDEKRTQTRKPPRQAYIWYVEGRMTK